MPKVKGLNKQVLDSVLGEEGANAPAPAPAPKAAPKPAPAAKAASTSSSSKPLTFDELLENSIAQKEAALGFTLSDAEKARMAEKLKQLMRE